MDSASPLPYSQYVMLLLIRPLSAIIFVLSLILFGWLLAWKLVLVYVPLVQEVCKSLKKKPKKAKPPTGRLSRYYNGGDSKRLAAD